MGRRAMISIACVLGAAVLLVLGYFWFRAPPQIGSDASVRKTVDALYTAVTSRDAKRLNDCEQRLKVLREEGKLPAEAAAYLDGIIQTAKAGRWETAAQRLWQFIYEQRG
jgi:hypothetical protein